MTESVFKYRQAFWFRPTGAPEFDSLFLPAKSWVSEDRRAIMLPTNMFAGPVRFEVRIGADEASCAAEMGTYQRYEGDFVGEACSYVLEDMNHRIPVLDALDPGEYHAVILVSGVDPAQFDLVCEVSDERYLLLLQRTG